MEENHLIKKLLIAENRQAYHMLLKQVWLQVTHGYRILQR